MKPPIKSRPTAEPPLLMIGGLQILCNKDVSYRHGIPTPCLPKTIGPGVSAEAHRRPGIPNPKRCKTGDIVSYQPERVQAAF